MLCYLKSYKNLSDKHTSSLYAEICVKSSPCSLLPLDIDKKFIVINKLITQETIWFAYFTLARFLNYNYLSFPFFTSKLPWALSADLEGERTKLLFYIFCILRFGMSQRWFMVPPPCRDCWKSGLLCMSEKKESCRDSPCFALSALSTNCGCPSCS